MPDTKLSDMQEIGWDIVRSDLVERIKEVKGRNKKNGN